MKAHSTAKLPSLSPGPKQSPGPPPPPPIPIAYRPPPPPTTRTSNTLISLSISVLLFQVLFIKPSGSSGVTGTTMPVLSLPVAVFGLFGTIPSAFATTTSSRRGNSGSGRHSMRNSRNGHLSNKGRTLLTTPVPWWNVQPITQRPGPHPPGQLRAKGFGDEGSGKNLAINASIDSHDLLGVNRVGILTVDKDSTNEGVHLRRGMMGMMDMDQIMNDMGAWTHKDSPELAGKHGNSNGDRSSGGGSGGMDKILDIVEDPTTSSSTVKIIPDEHHVSAYLNKGILKRFLFLNDKVGNPLSITITPCTSILLWNVKFWPVSENGTEAPEHLKTYRTQRTVTFTEPSARRGIYSIDIRALHWDSYVHLYGTSFYPEPMRNYFPTDSTDFNKFSRKDHSTFPDNLDKFYQHSFSHSETTINLDSEDSVARSDNPLNVPLSEGLQINSNPSNNDGEGIKTSSSGNKPRIWVRRLRGNRLQVKWDASPVNPHLMNYCIVVNTRRDYSSLCSASGERFGVLPPDLMHVTYYGSNAENNVMVDSREEAASSRNNSNYHGADYNFNGGGYRGFLADSPDRHRQHRHRHGRRHPRQDNISRKARATYEDIVLGCVNKKTNYILNNLHQGRLYYFNVFLRDLSTNVSYPYLRTTLKYQTAKTIGNGLRDAKPTKVKLANGPGKYSKPTILKFNLNKPCNELTMYIMPCGGGSILYEVLHGNRSIFESSQVDSLDIIKVGLPQKGKYYVKIFQASNDSAGQHQARMAEVYVAKKNKRLPLPKLPPITKISEDESQRTCDTVSIQWWPSPDPRDNEYCIFLKEESRKRVFQFKKPNQCDVERSLKSDPYVTHSLCLQRTLTPEMMLLSQTIVGLQPGKTYVVQLIVRRHNGKSLSYDLHHVKTLENCTENE